MCTGQGGCGDGVSGGVALVEFDLIEGLDPFGVCVGCFPPYVEVLVWKQGQVAFVDGFSASYIWGGREESEVSAFLVGSANTPAVDVGAETGDVSFSDVRGLFGAERS